MFSIKDLSLFSLKAPLIYPFRTTLGQHDFLDNILVRLTLSDGQEGWGEAAIAPHITGETVLQTRKNLHSVGKRISGKAFRDHEAFARWLRQELPDNPAGAASLEMAYLDAVSKSRGIPLWRLFGKKQAKFKTDITIVISSLRETQSAAKKFYARGFRQFKIKIGRDWDLDFQRVLAVRKNAPRSQILLDANQGYTSQQAIRFLKDLANKNIHPVMIEQPVPRGDLEGLIRIQRAKLAPVCADEAVKTLADAQRIIKNKAADIINIKLMKSGFWESLKMIRLARSRGLRLMIGGMMESSLAVTAAAHFAAGLNCFDFIDLDPPFFIKGPWGQSPCLNSRGIYDVSKVKAGIGQEVHI